ncbi:MAG: hypothetical protein V1678_03170 [Candidatus Aenigmatarchaeota archaeon]
MLGSKWTIDVGYIKKVVADTKILGVDDNGTACSKRFHSPIYALNELSSSIRYRDIQQFRVYLAAFGTSLFSDANTNRQLETVHNMIFGSPKESVARKSTSDYVFNHPIPGFQDFVDSYINSGKNKRAMMTSRNPLAKIVAEIFGLEILAVNDTPVENGVYLAPRITIKTGNDKERAVSEGLKKNRLSYEDLLYVGDGNKDIETGLKAKHFWASPEANKGVKERADFIVRDYRPIAEIINRITKDSQHKMPLLQI